MATGNEETYQGILFPERAEFLREAAFRGYRVFLQHWDTFARQLREFYEGLHLRRQTRCLLVYGPQGSGKTLFANKLRDDFLEAKTKFDLVPTTGASEPENLWHRMTGGGTLSPELIRTATLNTDILLIEDDKEWATKAREWAKTRQHRNCLVIADNAERTYFLQSLIELSDAEFLKLGGNPETVALAAQRFVGLCRGDLRGCLFVLLTNDEDFSLRFVEAVDKQHRHLVALAELPPPGPAEKETVVRVNTNRLNRISYWFCLDKAGPNEKKAAYEALKGASTFPHAFAAVDRAIRGASVNRMGRPARKNLITLLVLTATQPPDAQAAAIALGTHERIEVSVDWISSILFKERWATGILSDQQAAGLLESEWQLRVIMLGAPFVVSLLRRRSDDVTACTNLLEHLQRFLGPGTLGVTRDSYAADVAAMVKNWPDPAAYDLVPFWSKGQVRANEYEASLATILSGYNTQQPGFLNYRPDYIVSPFVPCSILSANSADQEELNNAIRRNAHVFEFAAIRTATVATIQSYLQGKLSNYVMLTREQ